MYKAVIDVGHVVNNKTLWKLKVMLKIKIFMWYLIKGVVLTKDNITKQNLEWHLKCSLCSNLETIHHFFLDCCYARFICRLTYFKFGIKPPRNVNHMFGSWLNGFDMRLRKSHFSRCTALFWAV